MDAETEAMVEEWRSAKRAKDFAAADRLRDVLRAAGVEPGVDSGGAGGSSGGDPFGGKQKKAPKDDAFMMPAPSPQKSETRLGGPEVLAPPNRPEDANPRVDPKLWDFEKPLMLTEPSMMQIQTLWLILDKTGDERISYEDFLALAGGHGETDQKRAIAKWQEMAKFFDTDHSGDVTPFEFIDGFKRKAMSEELDWEGIQSMPKKTYLDVQAQYNESVNRRLQNLVKKAHAFLAQDAAPPGTVIKLSPLWNEHRSTRKISKDLTEQLLINTENQEKIEKIFKHLDETKDGVLTKEDFRSTTEGKVSLRDGSSSLPFGRRSPPAARHRGPSAAQLRRAASGAASSSDSPFEFALCAAGVALQLLGPAARGAGREPGRPYL
jgi:Ca2+-binding EF-hand superfamily protein